MLWTGIEMPPNSLPPHTHLFPQPCHTPTAALVPSKHNPLLSRISKLLSFLWGFYPLLFITTCIPWAPRVHSRSQAFPFTPPPAWAHSPKNRLLPVAKWDRVLQILILSLMSPFLRTWGSHLQKGKNHVLWHSPPPEAGVMFNGKCSINVCQSYLIVCKLFALVID